MVSSIQRLGLTPNATIEQRKLAVDLAEVIVKWEFQRVREHQDQEVRREGGREGRREGGRWRELEGGRKGGRGERERGRELGVGREVRRMGEGEGGREEVIMLYPLPG